MTEVMIHFSLVCSYIVCGMLQAVGLFPAVCARVNGVYFIVLYNQ